MTRSAPTTAHPNGTTVDNLTYHYTARTNRLASVADAVTTDLDWDAKPSTFLYNRVGSLTQMTETLPGSISRTTAITRYDERQLPENLTITLSQGMSILSVEQVRYRYDVNGQRILKRIPGIGLDERYVRDGMRLIGVFDANNNLKSWNLGGAAGLVGRADVIPMELQPVPRYYVTDHLGSIRAVVNHSGTVIEGRDYYPYGLTMPGRFYVASDTTREGYTGHELDKETGLYYAGARFYDPALGRWLVPDPLADMYPGTSPFVYVLGNPISLFDPDGREVRCRTEEDCQMAADELNAAHANHDGDTNISIEATQWEESAANWWNPFSWGKTRTVEGFRLSTSDSEFDWSQDPYTSALYDVINSEEIIFNLQLIPGDTDLTGRPLHATAFDAQGINRSYPGGGNILVSRDGNRLNEPVGVVLMHELVGHGHPTGRGDALAVNRHYQQKLGYGLAAPRAASHGGYHTRIGWIKIGLYNR